MMAAFCSVGACMLNTRGANLNLVEDHPAPLETTTQAFISVGKQYTFFMAVEVKESQAQQSRDDLSPIL